MMGTVPLAPPAEDAMFWFWLVITPAVIGVGALVGGVLLAKKSQQQDASAWIKALAVLLILVALGIGSCFAYVLSGGIR